MARTSRPTQRTRSRPRPSAEAERWRRMQQLVIQGELAATAVHEISNLQTIVLFNAGLLRERYRDDPTMRAHLDPLLHAATMIASMCGQLRNLAHPAEARSELMDLGEISRGAFRLLETIIGRQLVFERTTSEPVLVVAASAQVEQMLINLVLNARDATNADRGRIVVRVGLGKQGSRGRPWLEVEDNGIGMSPEVRRRVFTKFFTTKPAGRGTGLGLVTVQRLLAAIGGHVTISSRVGRGTRIRLNFPMPTARQSEAYRPSPAEVRWPQLSSSNPFHEQARVS